MMTHNFKQKKKNRKSFYVHIPNARQKKRMLIVRKYPIHMSFIQQQAQVYVGRA